MHNEREFMRSRHLDLGSKNAALRLRRGEVVVEVESTFANGNNLGVGLEDLRHPNSQLGRCPGSLVRVNPHSPPYLGEWGSFVSRAA
jgi:hypothetical protein